MWSLNIDVATILLAVPAIALVNPYITQFVKRGADTLLKGSPNYDWTIRILTCFLAAVVGLGWLILRHYQLHTFFDFAVTVAVLFAYGLGGGPLSMAAYSFLNGYLRQSPPSPGTLKSLFRHKTVTPIVQPLASTETAIVPPNPPYTVAPTANPDRQPY